MDESKLVQWFEMVVIDCLKGLIKEKKRKEMERSIKNVKWRMPVFYFISSQ